MEYIFSAVKVCSNPYVSLFLRIKMPFFLLSMCGEKLISTPKFNTFRPDPPPGNEKIDLLSNPIP